jgi:hypothetical protein
MGVRIPLPLLNLIRDDKVFLMYKGIIRIEFLYARI